MSSRNQDRRQLGRYDTPQPLCQALVAWAIRDITDCAIEPSSGSGVFVESVLERLRSLGHLSPQEQVWACDVDPRALAETLLRAPIHHDHLWEADFLTLVDRDGVKGRKFNCIVGNPPFVSLHRMSASQRRTSRAFAKRVGISLDFRASLWAFFVAAATCALVENGRLALILPEAALQSDYARDLLPLVGGHFTNSILVSIRERCFLADGAAERVVVLLAEGYKTHHSTRGISLHEVATVSQINDFLVGRDSAADQPLPQLNGHAVPHLLRSSATRNIDLAAVPQSHTLAEFAEVKIGVVTGANHFFVLSEPQRLELSLPVSALIPLLAKFQLSSGFNVSRANWEKGRNAGKKCWLFFPDTCDDRRYVVEYLATYEEKERENNRTFAKRKPWFRTDIGLVPDAFLQYMGTQAPRAALNGALANCTNTVHRLYFKESVSWLQRKAIVLALHSSFSQLSAEFEGRAYGSGVLKLEPSDARRLRLILPQRLNAVDVEKTFAAAEGTLRRRGFASAVSIIDAWLYRSTAGLSKLVPSSALSAWLSAAVQRRLGRSRASSQVPNRKTGSANCSSAQHGLAIIGRN